MEFRNIKLISLKINELKKKIEASKENDKH